MDSPENARRQAEALFKRKENSLLDSAIDHAELIATREKPHD